MTVDELEILFTTFELSAFRLEQQAQYRVPGDDEAFAAWSEGRPVPAFTVETSPWLRLIAETSAAGRRWSRVHLVELPLNDYNRFRLATDYALVEAGEDHYVADRGWSSDLAAIREDVWIFDERLAVTIQFDAEGHFLGLTQVPDGEIGRYLAWRDAAMRWAVPLTDFNAARERRSE